MKRNTMMRCAALALCLMLALTCTAAMAGTKVTRILVGDRGVSLRRDPWVSDNNKIASIHQGTVLDVIDTVNGWYYVRYRDNYGYVSSSSEWTTVIASEVMDSSVTGRSGSRWAGGYGTTYGQDSYGYGGGYGYSGGYDRPNYDANMIREMGGEVIEQYAQTVQGGGKLRSSMDDEVDDNIVKSIHEYTEVYVYFSLPAWGRAYPWYYVRTADGMEGYIYGRRITFYRR